MRAALVVLLVFGFTLAVGCDGRGRAIDDVRIVGRPGKGAGLLHQPRAITVLPEDGSCVVIDRSGRIHHFRADGSLIQSWYLPESQQGQPIDVTYSPWGTLLIGDTHYQRILEMDLDGNEIRRFGQDVGLELVRGIICSEDGVIYVADYGLEDRVHRFDREGRHLGSFGSKGDGPDQFQRPEGITIADNGDVYVVDCGHHRILRFSQEGEFLGSFGGPGDGPGQFLYPFDITAGSEGTLFVVDYKGHRVQHFTSEGEFLGEAGGPGVEPGLFSTPRGIAVQRRSGGDIVYVADTYNHRVQQFVWEYDL